MHAVFSKELHKFYRLLIFNLNFCVHHSNKVSSLRETYLEPNKD